MEIVSTCLLLLALVLGVYYLLYRRMNCFKDTEIPHFRPVPIFGNFAWNFLGRVTINDLINNMYNINRDAKYVGFYLFSTPGVIIRDPELIKLIAVKHFDTFPNHNTRTSVDDTILNKNLLTLTNQEWKDVRNTLSPFFTANRIRNMFLLMTSCASEFVDFIARLPKHQRDLDLKDIFTRYTNDVIARCAFGLKINSMLDRDNKFYLYGKECTTFSASTMAQFILLAIAPRIAKLFGIRVIRKHVSDFFYKVVREIVEEREKTGTSQPDMIQLMMDSRGKKTDKQDLSIEEMTSQAFIFFLAGFETTSILPCYAAHELAVNPDIQERLQKEIDDVLDANDGRVTYEAINQMKYLDAVLLEALRMNPPSVVTDRVSVDRFELPPTLPGTKPFVLKKDSNIWFPIYSLQRDPKYFEDPDTFNPDRYLDGNKSNLNSAVYIPFGIGPRMCIGNRFALVEIKTLLFYLLARCNLKISPKTCVPLKLSKTRPMHAEGGFWLRIQPRSEHRLKSI